MTVSATAPNAGGLGLEAFRERARALVPELRERAQRTEALRHIPEESIAALRQSGLIRILQPQRAGGYELPYRSIVELPAILAAGCASTSWVYANLACHAWVLGMWPQEAQDEVWDRDRNALIASSLIYRCGRARRVPGGYRLSGRWPFASGIDAAAWNICGAILFDDKDEPGLPRMFLVPTGAYRIIDTWQVVGLAGTGSKDVEIEDAFVPEHRSLALTEALGGPTPGSAVNPSPLYRLPLRSIVSYCLAGTALGIAQAVVAEFIASSRTRLTTYTGRNVADFTTVQMRIAEAAALVDAAEALLVDNCDEAEAMTAAMSSGGPAPEVERRSRWRRDGAFATMLGTRAVDLLYTAAGGAGIYERNPIQRAFRDIHAAGAHFGLSFDVNGAGYGRVALGLPPEFPV